MIITPESKIQQQIVQDFNNLYCTTFKNPRLIIYSVPNGINFPLPNAQKIRVLDQLNKTGSLAGASDLIIQGVNGRIVNIEVKAETKQSSKQIEFQQRVQDLGGVYLLVFSLEDFKEKINIHIDWLLGKV